MDTERFNEITKLLAEKAREAVRALLAAGSRSGPITVWLHDGTWMRRGPLELGKADFSRVFILCI